ncbi:hypothetical protein ACLOJK_004795 [Asimina triloba]
MVEHNFDANEEEYGSSCPAMKKMAICYCRISTDLPHIGEFDGFFSYGGDDGRRHHEALSARDGCV